MKQIIILFAVFVVTFLHTSAQQVGVCTSLRNVEAAKAAGCDFIEETVGGFLMPDKTDEDFAVKLEEYRKSGIKILSFVNFIPASIKITGDQADHPKALAWAETTFRRAEQTGVKIVVLGSGGARKLDERYEYNKATAQFISLLKAMGPIAAKHNITVAIEPLNRDETNFIHTLEEGVQSVKQVNHPNIRLLCDIYHMSKENEGPQAIIKAKKYVAHAHVAESPNRTAPGIENIDLRPYYQALQKARYKGGISMECRWKDFAEEVKIGVKTIRKQWNE